MDTGKKFNAPRQLIKWFEKLGVNHKITALRTAFSNGYVVAEILAQLEPGINLNQFYDSLGLPKKFQNWEIITRILEEKEFVIKPEEVRDVIFMEEGAALALMIRLCEFYTKTKIIWEAKAVVRPFNYLAPNITSLMRNNNVATIVSTSEKRGKILGRLDRHAREAKDAKSKMNLKEHIKKNRRNFLLAEISKLKLKEVKAQNAFSKNVKDENTVLLRQYQKNNNSTTKVLSLAEMKNELLGSIAAVIEKNYKRFVLPEESLAPLGQQEIKQALLDASAAPQRTLELILDTCTVYAKTLSELYENNLPDFLCFFEILLAFLSRLEEKTVYWKKVKALFQTFGEQFYAESDDFLVIFMENTGFKILREVCRRRLGKRDYFAAVIKSFMPGDENEKVKYLCQMKENFGDDLREFSTLLTRVACLEDNFGKDQVYFNTLVYYANLVIKTSSPISIVNGLKLLHVLAPYNCMKISLEVANLEFARLLRIDWWEVKAQLLVIISEVLKLINRAKREKQVQDGVQGSSEPSIKNMTEDGSGIRESKEEVEEDEEGEEEGGEDEFAEQKSAQEASKKASEVEIDPLMDLSSTDLKKFEDDYENFLKKMLLEIFTAKENLNIVKIGLIYTAELTHFNPDFAKPYFDILVSVSPRVLQVLLSEEHHHTPLLIVAGPQSFPYIQTGVHHQWDAAVIVNKMSEKILSEGIQVLDPKLSLILHACLKSRIKHSARPEWLKVFTKLEEVLLNSLVNAGACEDALKILKIFLGYQFICDHFARNSSHKLSSVLNRIYQREGLEQEKQCFLDFVTFLDEEMKVTDFVFEVLKKFSETHFREFFGSNLAEYANKLAAMRRNREFGNGFLKSLLAF